MPRVIEDVPAVEKRATCSHCGRTIAYVDNDVQEYRGRDISGGPDGMRWVVCPGTGCGKKIVLESW